MTIKEYLLELKKYSPYDFSEYSDNSIQRRLQKVMDLYELTLEQLHAKTLADPNFVEQLVNDITVNTTEFFRDSDVWVEYMDIVLPTFKAKKQLKIWHAGSSTGQEVYSNLMLLDHFGYLKKAQILATDINRLVLSDASKGTYRHSTNIKNINAFEASLTEDNKIDFGKYFTVNTMADTININSTIKNIAVFKKNDLVKDTSPSAERFDIIFCRNVLIYFNATLQSKILKMFYDSLLPAGVLILGNHESLNGFFKTRFAKTGSFYTKNNAFHFKY
ncbi:MAG: CheR family methyltransferase [Breznakibacter sp.]